MSRGPEGGAAAGLDDLTAIDDAIAALEAQRGALGEVVVETAIAPLRARRAAILAGMAGGQRKQVTVLFADLVDFTAMSRRLDAEDVRSVVNSYFSRWRQVIEQNGGVVEKFIGDAVMAVFGLHQALEDDPHRAIRAALAMKTALGELNADLETEYGITLQMRVGIDTGEVVVSMDRPDQEVSVVGETVNLASRLQAEAPEDGVLISGDTYRHVRGGFSFRPLGALSLKGVDRPVYGHVVIRERPRRFELDEGRGVEGVETKTIGRDPELLKLQQTFEDVVDEGGPRVVTIVGDAGVGKSRLFREFDRWLAEIPDPVWWFRGRASPPTQNLPHALLREMMAARLDIQESDDPDAVRAKWEDGMAGTVRRRIRGPLSHRRPLARFRRG